MIDQMPNLAFATVDEQGIHFETGVPVAFRFLRNTEKSPYMGARFGQDIEPAGRYMIHNEEPGEVARGWESGVITFENPLVILLTLDGEVYGPTGWKARLRDVYGLTGQELSRRLLADGYDGIVTVGEYEHRGRTTRDTREIVDLRTVKANPRRQVRARLLGVPKCSVRGCGRDHYARGWCMRHYMHNRVSADHERSDLTKPVRACRARACSRDAVVNRFCRKHAVQFRVHGRLTPERELGVGRRCDIRRCQRPHAARGLCAKHYDERVRRNPDAPQPMIPADALAVPIVAQATRSSCGAASLAAVLYYFQAYDGAEHDLHLELGTTDEDGTAPRELVRCARRFGLQAEMRERQSIDDLRRGLRRGEAQIVNLQAWRDPDDMMPWAGTWEHGHYVVLIGMDDHYAYFMDPISRLGYAFMPLSELPSRMHDYASDGTEYFGLVIAIRGKNPLLSRSLIRMDALPGEPPVVAANRPRWGDA